MMLLRSVVEKMIIEICGQKGAIETEILMSAVCDTGQPKRSRHKVEKSPEGIGNNSFIKRFHIGLKSYQ